MRTVTPTGHTPQVWAPLLDAADVLDVDDLFPTAPGSTTRAGLLVVSAHPDDETIGAGRLLAALARAGREVRAVLLTAGEACLDHVSTRPTGLAGRRLAEWSAALDLLGVGPRRMSAGLPDGRVGEEMARAAAAIEDQVDDTVGVILAPWPNDPHPDHAAAGLAAARVARRHGLTLLNYPVWMTYWADPVVLAATRDRLVRVATSDADDAARADALACFTSQLEPLEAEFEPVVPAGMLDHHDAQLLLLPASDRSVSATCPTPAALGLPPDYDRHDPSVQATTEAMRLLVAARPWARLTWPDLVDALIALGRTDIPLARLVEGHIDAVRILDQAGAAPEPGALYGVWASRSRGTGVRAAEHDGGWQLDGMLRFASGVGLIDRALVPAWPTDDTHLLFDVPVLDWPADETAWQTSAMTVSRSHPTEVVAVRADANSLRGEPNFYLSRPGFHAGGLGVAAVWAGCGARVVDLVLDHVGTAPGPPTRAVRLGRMRAALTTALATLGVAAERLEVAEARADTATITALAGETRSVVATAVATIIEEAKAVVGPAGLGYDAAFTHAVADLDLYVRQANLDGEFGRLGAGLH